MTAGKANSEGGQFTVLIADDEPSVRLLVQATIQTDGYHILEATDGNEAWSLIQEYRPSLVLLDVKMPGRTGLEILREIRAEPDLVATKVILLSASAQESEINAGLVAGADFYLTKPFSPRDLLAKIDEALLL